MSSERGVLIVAVGPLSLGKMRLAFINGIQHSTSNTSEGRNHAFPLPTWSTLQAMTSPDAKLGETIHGCGTYTITTFSPTCINDRRKNVSHNAVIFIFHYVSRPPMFTLYMLSDNEARPLLVVSILFAQLIVIFRPDLATSQ